MTDSRGWDRLLLLPLRRPRATLLLVLLVTLAAAFGWRHVRFEPDLSSLLPPDHPHVRIAALLDDRSRPARTLWLLLHDARPVAAVPPLAAALRALPGVAEVAITRDELFAAAGERAAQAPLWFLADDQLAALAEALSPAGRAAAIADRRADLADDPLAAGELLRADPLGLRWLLAGRDAASRLGLRGDTELVVLADGEHALLRLTGIKDAYDAEFATALLHDVEAVLAGHEVTMFGGYAVARADQARIRADFERASTWSVVAIAAYLIWTMRGLRLPLLVQLPAALSIAWAVPLGSALFGPLPTVAVAAVAVLCGLGVDFAIHYAARYRHARLQHGHDAAVRLVQRATVPELLIDMATTAVTFLAIGGGQLRGLASFGWLLALGLCASVLVTTTALPVLLRFVGDRRDPERSLLAAAADRWGASRVARPVAFGVVLLALGALAFVASRGVPVAADPDVLRPVQDPVRAARLQIEDRLGFSTVPVAVSWPLARDASALWQALHELQQGGAVRFWSGLERTDTDAGRAAVAALRRRIDGFVPAALDEFAAAGLAADLLRPALEQTAARFAADPPPRAPTTVTLAEGEHRVVLVWPAGRLSTTAFAALAERLAAMAPGAAVHGGPSVQVAIEALLRADLQRAILWALLLAVGMVSLWLRSVRLGLLALLPSGIGLLATLVLLHAIDLPLSLVSFVAVPFVLGIGVDEGVHMVGHFRHGAADSGATGVGVVRTSIGTVLGFGALGFAESPGLQALGGIVAFGSLLCMLACLFVLAPLLRAGARGRPA
ncbi:MAG: MMPL family transporter [Planctomycetes bacterium]|nr:MMPL family transporter [Planctomycetota bacterium]